MALAWGAHRGRVKAGLRSGRRVGFPRFKRRRHEQGFRADNGPDTVRVDGKVVILPKIGRIAMVEDLRFRGSIREVTVNRTARTWFACFCIYRSAALRTATYELLSRAKVRIQDATTGAPGPDPNHL